MQKPIKVDETDFETVERYHNGYDVSVLTPHGDTVNIYIDSKGVTHVTLQELAAFQPKLYES